MPTRAANIAIIIKEEEASAACTRLPALTSGRLTIPATRPLTQCATPHAATPTTGRP